MNPKNQRRKDIRLKHYDYSQPGVYFVTICAKARLPLFGEIVDGEMVLNDIGEIIKQCWHEIPKHFPFVILDEFIIMPNHVHGILMITDRTDVGANNHSPLRHPTFSRRWENDHRELGICFCDIK